MADTGFDPGDVPALRRELHDWIRDGRGLAFHARMSHSAGTMMGRPDYDGHPGMMRAYAEMLVAQEARTLREAELYFVTAEMTDIVRTAAKSMPAFPPEAGDFPTPAGLIVYETPLVEYRRPQRMVVSRGDRVAFDLRGDQQEEIGVTACTWGPYNASGHWPTGGVWMSFYRNRAEILDNLPDDRVRDDIRADVARLVPDNEYAIQYPADAMGKASLEESLAAVDQPGYTSYWAKHLLATLLLMRQPLIYQRTEPVRRGLRRHLQRAGHPVGDIRILDARPHRYESVPQREDFTEQTDDAADTGRRLSVRFPVRGFWRNQWYASRGVHRPRWIDPHWRGPEDAPIVHPERVRVLRPHATESESLDRRTATEADHG